jgi:GNAT superfamily N-acetyltransferase
VRGDIPELAQVMTRAFDDDTQKHLGVEKGGPPGYDDGEFFRKWMLGYEESVGYKVLVDGQIVGCAIVWIYEHGRNRLGVIFVEPACQDQGVGSRIWQFVEATYPDAESWTLDTPSFATKNHYFYEKKCGFKKIDEKVEPDGPGTSAFIYRKEVRL